MATYNGNNYYLLLDSVDVSSFTVNLAVDPGNSDQDITAGAGTTHVKRALGLDDYSIKFTLMYDSASLSTYIQKLKPGATVVIEAGIEGHTAGMPRHVQSCLISKSGVATEVTKSAVMFECEAKGADAPSTNMFAGATY